MNRFRTILMAGLLAVTPLADATALTAAAAQDSWRQERAREESQRGQRISASEALARVSAGRPGRRLGVTERNAGGRPIYVVRWEYPGGRVADIMVDGQTGAIMGER